MVDGPILNRRQRRMPMKPLMDAVCCRSQCLTHGIGLSASGEDRGSGIGDRGSGRRRMTAPKNPLRYFDSSPKVIRLVVMMYVKHPLSLRNVEEQLFERGIDVRL